MCVLPYEFYNRDTRIVGRELLGKLLVNESTAGIIVETESYMGENDPASHAARKKTPRNSVMFGSSGVSYVYFIYGNHYCFNVVAHKDNIAGAVLIRAVEPSLNTGLMIKRRKINDIKNLTNGPGKLTQALGINKKHNGITLLKGGLYIKDTGLKVKNTAKSSRIGIKEGTELLYRYYIKGNPFVSGKKS
ncbi:MAG: DNA-3-methyladenine glycosylase [Armatimonadota bacterium]